MGILTTTKQELVHTRQVQRALAVYRDDGYCVFCYWLNHTHRQYEQIHHVYGRGRKADDMREDYRNLLCVCAECHTNYSPIISKRDLGKGLSNQQIWVLRLANEFPINPNFISPSNLRDFNTLKELKDSNDDE